jgi:hypothetical protein
MGPFAVWAVVLALLVPLAFLAGSDEDGAASAPPIAAVETIAERVESLRDLRFDRLPEPVRVTPEQAAADGLADFDKDYPPARRETDERLYSALGLLPEDVDLKKLARDIFGEQVAGYYDPRTGRLRIVEGAATGGRVSGEMIIAHELTHALEDQGFALDLGELAEGGDGALAYSALVEGTATVLMYDYVDRYFSSEEALGGLLASAFAPTGELPPFMMAQLLFPYSAGAAFVRELRPGTSWQLVDLAYKRPPVSTEQILHPEKYLRIEAPREVDLPRKDGTFGEWQTAELLSLAGGTDVGRAAAGWGGDAYSVSDEEVVIRWVWDTPSDREEFVAKLRAYTREMKRGTVTTAGESVTLTVPLAG